MKKNALISRFAIAACTMAISQMGFATEGGGGIYPNGAENYVVGAFPPPGVHYLLYASTYKADQLKGQDGNQIPLDFNLRVNVVAPRVVWNTGLKVLGGDLGFYGIAPLLDIDASIGGRSQRKTGLGDMGLGIALGYHPSDKWHYVVAIDLNMPTGDYDKNNLVNFGRNYWNAEPVLAISYLQSYGLNADLKLMYDFNATNNATSYKSGQEFHADYSIGWATGTNWVFGIGGYVYRQTTGDKVNGVDIGNRGTAAAIGPSIKYDSGKGWFLTAKWQKEFNVVNRPQGDAFWVKAILPF